jgi:dTDP-4-amino-4,6-dideoxygalactose transaminase
MRQQYLPYFKPSIGQDDIDAVVESMRNGWLTTGPKVQQLEKDFAELSGARHAIALNSCTAALHLGLIALGVVTGDEVVMPSLTFVAGAQCVRQLGGTPVFCDVDPRTLCVTTETLRAVTTDRTRAIIPMQFGGRPVGIEGIVDFAHSRGIAVLEDAAHAVGTLDNGLWPGAKSDAAAFSFYATKNVTSAEGGMFVTNRDEVAERVRMLSLHGMNRDAWKRYQQGGAWRYDVIATGYKDNMPDMLAALGIAQLSKLQSLQSRRDELARHYLQNLADIPGLRPASDFLEYPNRHSWCVFAILVDESEAQISRDALIEILRAANIGTSVHFIPSHLFSAYGGASREDLPHTERIWKKLLSLPLYPAMSISDVDDVIGVLRAATVGQRKQEQATPASA